MDAVAGDLAGVFGGRSPDCDRPATASEQQPVELETVARMSEVHDRARAVDPDLGEERDERTLAGLIGGVRE